MAPDPLWSARTGEVAMPRVSIVITCHNHGRFLRDAIESALNQTFHDREIVLIDDGSTDDTPDIAAAYPMVRSVAQARQGLSAARNAGLRSCTGELVTFLDADDRLLPHAVAEGVRALDEHPDAACAAGHYRLIAEDGSYLAEWQRAPVDADSYAALLRRNHIGMHAAVLYRREIFTAIGGFDPSLTACEDYDLLLRLARRRRIHLHEALIAEYRQHGGNMSRDPALMLRTALRVHRAQWPHARGLRGHRDAYQEGRQFWQEFYGEQLVDDVRRRLREGGGRQALGRDLVTLLIYHRKGFRACRRQAVLYLLGLRGIRRRLRAVRRRLVGAVPRPPFRPW
jgi:hypothetical protein